MRTVSRWVVFDDLNRTIAALLRSELPADLANQVTISFATPDESFPPQGLALPAINLFLFEVRENAQRRQVEPDRDRTADGRTILVPSPTYVDCHYIVTAIAAAQTDPEMDEHRVLGAALVALLRYRVLPLAVLQGVLAGQSPPVRGQAVRQDASPSGIDLWQALKGKPRTSLHYTLTVPVNVGTPQEAATPVASLQVGGA
jgi:hypothetical protein